jgi:hypothetical protein
MLTGMWMAIAIGENLPNHPYDQKNNGYHGDERKECILGAVLILIVLGIIGIDTCKDNPRNNQGEYNCGEPVNIIGSKNTDENNQYNEPNHIGPKSRYFTIAIVVTLLTGAIAIFLFLLVV